MSKCVDQSMCEPYQIPYVYLGEFFQHFEQQYDESHQGDENKQVHY